MTWHFPNYAFVYLLNILFALWLALTVWKRARTWSIKIFSFFLLLIALWTFLLMMETISLPMAQKLFWARLEYIPIVSSGPVWLQFCYQYQEQRKLFSFSASLLWIIPVLTLAFLFTPHTTFLIWSQISTTSIANLPVLVYQHGPWFWVNVMYSYLLFLLGTWYLAQGSREPLFRKQNLALISGLLLPIGGSLLYISKLNPVPGLDWTPFGFSLTALIYAFSLLKLNLFDLTPIPRQQLMEYIRDGLIVLDHQQRLIEANPAAQHLLSLPKHWVGLPISQTTWPELAKQPAHQTQVRILHRADRCFELQSLPIQHGRLLILRDITNQQTLQNELRQSKESYQRLIELSPEMICVHVAGKLLYINPNGASLVGANNPEQLLGRSILDFVHPDDHPIVLERVRRTEGQNQTTEWLEERFIDLAGNPIPVEVISAPIVYQNIPATLVIAHDIRKHKQAEQAETEQRQFIETLNQIAAALNSTLQIDDVFNRILDGVGKIIPHDAVSLMMIEGPHVHIINSRGYAERALEQYIDNFHQPLCELPTLCHIMETGQPLIISNIHQSALWRHCPENDWIQSYLGAPIHLKNEIIGFLNLDSATPNFFTEQHARRLQAFLHQAATAIENAHLYQEVQQLAIIDELTGLYNRRGLLKLGESEIERNQRQQHSLSVLFMDVDHFKDFNNTYSYAVGDRALRHVADTLRASLREVDIIARYGGDEFVVLLPQTPLNEAKGIAERIQRQLAQNPLEVRQGSLPVNVTIGIYDLSQKDVNLLSVLETAGKIMRQAKENYSGIASL